MRIAGTIELDGLYVTFNQGTSQQTTVQAGAPASNIVLQLPTTADTLAGIAATQTLTNKTINAANNTISNLTVAMLAAGVLNTSTTLTGATDSQVPSALAAKTYADNVSVAGLATKADKTTTISAGTGLTGGGDLSANRTIALADTAVTLGSYGSATQVATFTVDQQGRLTAAGNTSIQIAESQVTGLVSDLAGKQAADVDLDALAALTTTGLIARTGSGSAATRTITAPAAGITISNGDGVSGNPTLALANDLAALEGLSGTGIAVRTASDTWAQRSVAAGTGISVTNGDGVSGNPTVAIDSTVATLTGTQALTNKDYDGGTASNTSRLTVPKNTYANLLTLTRKEGTLLYATDLDTFFADDGTNLTAVGSGSGSGTGTLNIVDNPSAASSTTGWTAATNYTVTRDTTNSPLAGVIDTCFAISTTTASTESTTSGVYAASLAMPAALRNSKVQANLWVTVPATSAGVWRLSVYNASGTRMSLDRDSSSVFTLPGGYTGQLPFTFDADSSATYTISFTQTTRTSANTLYATLISIGNGNVSQTAAVGEFESTTSYIIGATSSPPSAGSGATYLRTVSRDGEYANIRWEYRQGSAGSAGTGAYLLPLPTGLSINYAKAGVLATSSALGIVGSGRVDAGNSFSALPYVRSDAPYTNKVGVVILNDTTNIADWGGSTGTLANSSVNVSIVARIPIAEWAGSVYTAPVPAEEWVYNTDTSTSDNTYAFAYGPAGQTFGSFTSNTTGVTSKRVRFQYPQQDGDVIAIEVFSSALGWVPLEATYLTANRLNTSVYGIDIVPVSGSTTDFDVRFGKAGASAAAAATYAATNSDPWSGYTTWKWRVRKTKKAALPFAAVSATADGLAKRYDYLAKIRLHTGNGHGSTNTNIRRFTTTVVNTGSGITYADSSTAGASFTVTEAGIYTFTYADVFSGASNFGLSLNSSQLTTGITSITAADRLVVSATSGASASYCVSMTLALSVGDVVRPHTDAGTESIVPARVSFTVQRIA